MYYQVIATSDYGFYVDANNIVHLETTIAGVRRDYTLTSYKNVICIDDTTGLWHSCYIIRTGALGNITYIVLGMPSNQLRRGRILTMVDGNIETYFKITWVSPNPNGGGQMIPWDPR
jgi:hypothetical protein